MPHGHCFFWTPTILVPYVLGNLMTLTAYISIPIIFFLALRRGKEIIAVPRLFSIYALFILSCGFGHGIAIWNLWHADYWLESRWSIVTGIISLAAAGASVKTFRHLIDYWEELNGPGKTR